MKTFSNLFEQTLDLDPLNEIFGKKKKAKKGKKVNSKLMKKRSKLFKKNPKKFKKKAKKTKTAFVRPILKKAKELIHALAKKFKLAEKRLNEQSDEKVRALADWLGIDDEDIEDEIEETNWDTFEAEGGEYMVLTDDEADEATKRYIEESIWAFNAWFLEQYIDEQSVLDALGYSDDDIAASADPDDEDDPYHEASIEDDPEEWFYVFMGMSLTDWIADQQNKAEGANDIFFQIIDGQGRFDEFVDEAISADGRGHFISSYDGEENEQDDYFIYRVN